MLLLLIYERKIDMLNIYIHMLTSQVINGLFEENVREARGLKVEQSGQVGESACFLQCGEPRHIRHSGRESDSPVLLCGSHPHSVKCIQNTHAFRAHRLSHLLHMPRNMAQNLPVSRSEFSTVCRRWVLVVPW